MITWVFEPHLCCRCGSRIVRSVSGAGATPGGNPIYKCCNCIAHSYKNAEDICWCGCSHRNQSEKPYRCVPFSFVDTYPELASAFAANGYTCRSPFEIGVVLTSDWERITTTSYGKRDFVRVNTRWRHVNGNIYTILAVANRSASDDKRKEYPITVVYRGEDGEVWSKQIDLFLKNRTLLI